jgi:hypothetical protein
MKEAAWLEPETVAQIEFLKGLTQFIFATPSSWDLTKTKIRAQ